VLEARVLPVELELRSRELAQRIRVGKREQTAFAWRGAAAGLDDATARAELQRALDRADAELVPLRAELHVRSAEELAKLGFATPRAWAEALRPDVDLDSWARAARELLVATEPAWHDALRAAAGSGTPVRSGVDLYRALSLPRWATAFGGARFAALDSLCDAWRVRLGLLPGLAVDDAPREAAHPLPFLATPRVPGELLLRLPQRAAVLDLASELDLGGRALACGLTSDALPVESRLTGDRALPLAWGALFRERLFDPAWLASGPLAARADRFAADAALLRLAPLRAAAARTQSELALAALSPGSDPRALADAHASRMREALACDWSDAALLRDCRARPAALDELRAACFAAQLARQLRERHGRAFWRARACGELLRELWHTGTTYTVESLARQLDLGPVSVEVLARPAA
jgi:hypothetical protein